MDDTCFPHNSVCQDGSCMISWNYNHAQNALCFSKDSQITYPDRLKAFWVTAVTSQRITKSLTINWLFTPGHWNLDGDDISITPTSVSIADLGWPCFVLGWCQHQLVPCVWQNESNPSHSTGRTKNVPLVKRLLLWPRDWNTAVHHLPQDDPALPDDLNWVLPIPKPG